MSEPDYKRQVELLTDELVYMRQMIDERDACASRRDAESAFALNEARMAVLSAEDEIRDLKSVLALERNNHASDLDRDRKRIDLIRQQLDEVTTECRRLQRERDPNRLAEATARAREDGAAAANAECQRLRARIADLESCVTELKASKRKLRDALERARQDLQ